MEPTKKIINAIEKFNTFLIVSHVRPEGDSLGSQLAMANLLKAFGKDFVILNSDKVPAHYAFLPQVNLIQNVIGRKKKKFDAAIVLDCPNLARTGKVKNVIKDVGYIINIDHHPGNENFGEINWSEKRASSAGELVYRLFKASGSKITRQTALYLYIAILTDTGSFNYSNASAATHEIVSELLGYGIEPYDVSKNIYENKSLASLKLLGLALSGLKVTANGKVAYMAVGSELFRRTKTGPSDCENFVNFARSVRGVEAAVFFREDIEKKGLFHVSFRSGKKVDVNRIATTFGGGGHKSASGCAVQGVFVDVKRKVLKRVCDEL